MFVFKRHLFALVTLFIFSYPSMAQQSYFNPIDKKTYYMEEIRPQNSKEVKEKVSLKGINLLSGQAVFNHHMKAKDFASYIEKVVVKAKEIFQKSEEKSELLVHFEIIPKDLTLDLKYSGEPENYLMYQFYTSIQNMEKLKVKDKIIFQLEIEVNP